MSALRREFVAELLERQVTNYTTEAKLTEKCAPKRKLGAAFWLLALDLQVHDDDDDDVDDDDDDDDDDDGSPKESK